VINRKFPVVEVKGFTIKGFVAGLGTPFFKKVVIHKGRKFNITNCKMSVFMTESKFDMNTYVSISDLFFEKIQQFWPGVHFYASGKSNKVDVRRLKKYLTNAKVTSYCNKLTCTNSINHDNDNKP
jgi:hypothetical protein